MPAAPPRSADDHWTQHARQWRLIGPPLRPAAQDVAAMEHALWRWREENSAAPPRVLLLGVTEEIARMRWPPGTRLLAVDRSLAMIAALWPGAERGDPAVCAEWTRLPLRERSRDVVIGDGAFNIMADPDAQRRLAASIARVLRPGGLVLMRFFLRPDRAETVTEVVADLWSGRIGNFHVFKWRLAQALQGDASAGVKLADVWDAWHAAVPQADALAARLGWPREVLATIDNYRGAPARYTFPTLAEARSLFDPLFVPRSCVFPAYELGERCPTLACALR